MNEYESIAKSLLNSESGGKILKNMDKITALLKTEQGKKLVTSLASSNPELLKKAMGAIMSNDKALAKKIISELMSDKENADFAERLLSIIE